MGILRDDHGDIDPAWPIAGICWLFGFAVGLAVGLSRVGVY